MDVQQRKVRDAESVPVGGVFRTAGGVYMRLDVTRVRRGELPIRGYIRAVCLETGVVEVFDGDMPVVAYPRAHVELGPSEADA